jgi:hypothetical protein
MSTQKTLMTPAASSERISRRTIRAGIRQMPPGPADSPAPPWRLK